MLIRAKSILFFVFLSVTINSYAQEERLNELLDSLSTSQTDAKALEYSLKVASELKYTNWTRAEHYLALAKEKAEKSGSPELLAEFYKSASQIYYDRDAFDVAIDYNLKAYDFYKNQNRDEQYEIENSLAIIYARLNNRERAFYYFNRIYQHQKKIKNYPAVAKSLNNIGTLYLNYGKPDSALIFLKRSLKLLDTQSDNALKYYVITNVGRSYVELDKTDSAQLYFGKIMELLPEIKNQDTRQYVYNAIANYFLTKEEPQKAIDYALQAKDENTVKYSFSNLQVLQVLYKSYLALGEFEQSANYFQEYDRIRDSINIEAKAVNVEKQKIEHDFKAQAELNRLNDKEKRLTLTIIVLALFVILLILSIFLIRYKNKLIKEKLRNELNESRENELKLQIELKDKELASKTIAETRREEMYNSVLQDLKKIRLNTGKEETKQALGTVLNKLEHSSNKAIWEEFELRFSNIYESFYQNLSLKHPNLSNYDKRICALIKLNLSSKEIADVSGVSVKSVENIRTRLRKKLNLTNKKIELNRYISQI